MQAVGEAIDFFISPTYKDGSLIPLVITNNVFVHHCELAA
jgi:hypothetical protein